MDAALANAVQTLFDTSSLTSTLTQVVQFSFTNGTTTFHSNAVDYWGVSLEYALNTFAVGNLTNSECRVQTAVGGGRSTKGLAYGAANYSYQLTDNTKFIQGVSALANEETTLNSESALNVAINDRFSLRVAYTVTYNSKPPASAPKNTDTTTSVTLVYGL